MICGKCCSGLWLRCFGSVRQTFGTKPGVRVFPGFLPGSGGLRQPILRAGYDGWPELTCGNQRVGECGLSAASASSLSPSAVFLEHEGWLRTVVSSRLGETDAVDDVMQNIAMAVVRQKAALSGVQRVGAWLYRIAVRQVLMYRRATGRRRKLLQRVQSDAGLAVDVAEPLGMMLQDETQDSVRRALGQLGELERQLLLLKYAEGWSYRQIAERLGVQEDTVEYRLMKARRTLRRQLSALNVEGLET